MLRHVHFIFDLIAGFVGAIIIVCFLLIWRLNASPATSTLFTPYIQAGLNHILPGTHSKIASTVITWDNTQHSLALHAENIDITDDAGSHAILVPTLDLAINPFGLAKGHYLPIALKVDHPQIHLVRYMSGHWSLGSGLADSDINSTPTTLVILNNIFNELAHAHLTHRLAVTDLALTIEDASHQASWTVKVPEITLEHENKDLSGLIRLNVTQKDGPSTLELHYHYDYASELHNIAVHFDSITPSYFAGGNPEIIGLPEAAIFNLPLTGDMDISIDNHVSVQTATMQIHGDPGRLLVKEFWDQPRDVKSFDAKADYDKARSQQLEVSSSLDFDGPRFSVSVLGKHSSRLLQDMDFTMDIKLDNLPNDQLGQIWPQNVLPGARSWVVSSISKGILGHGEVNLKGYLAWNDLANAMVHEGKGKLSVSGARVDYLEGMPKIDNVNADADFDLSQMNILIHSGNTGDLQLVPFVIQINGLDKDIQTIDIPLAITSPVLDVLKVVDAPRLGYTKSLGLTPQDITGTVNGIVNLRFPLLKTLEMAEVELKAHADLTDVASSKLVPHIDITQGNLSFDLDKKSFIVKGLAALNKIPLQVTWRQYFETREGQPSSEGTVTGPVNGDQWMNFGIDTLNGTKGPINVALQITQLAKKQMLIDATLDMAAAEVHVDMINWKKSLNVPAILKFKATSEDNRPISISDIDLESAQFKAKGKGMMTPDATHFTSLDLFPFILGRSNAAIHYAEAKTSDHTVRIDAAGQAFDITGLLGGPSTTESRPQRFSVKLNKLYTSDAGYMTNVEGYARRDQTGWSEINIRGRAQGSPWLNIALLPRNDGSRTFLMNCSDFGMALQGMGFTSAVKNGALKVSGASTPEQPRVIEGTVKIGAFVVTDLPLMATLLNATSPFGFVDVINKTIRFDHLSGKFRWEGDNLEFMQAKLPGPSVGMNLDGKINIKSGEGNLYGTMVPFSMVNRFLNYIPILGDIITGGEGQGVLAVAFTITGALNKPNISVNPISLLTPGFIRNLFFGGEEDDDATSTDTPAKQDINPATLQ